MADKLASLVAEAWPHSFTSVNIMSALKKQECTQEKWVIVSWHLQRPSVHNHSHTISLQIHLLAALFFRQSKWHYKRSITKRSTTCLMTLAMLLGKKSIIQITRLAQALPLPSHLTRYHLKMLSLKSLCSLSQSQPQQGNLAEKTAACITDEDESHRMKGELDKKKQAMQAKEFKQAERLQKQAETESTRRETATANREKQD